MQIPYYVTVPVVSEWSPSPMADSLADLGGGGWVLWSEEVFSGPSDFIMLAVRLSVTLCYLLCKWFSVHFLASELLELKVEIGDTNLNPCFFKVKFIYQGTEIINYVVAPYLFYDARIAMGVVL